MQILLILLLSLLFTIDIESVPYYFQREYQNVIYTEEKENDILYSSENHDSNEVADYGEWVTDYPEVHISNLLKTFSGIAEIFSNSLDLENFSDGENIRKTNDMDLCESQKTTIKPREFKNINNVSKIIVNQKGAEQIISITVCILEGGKCSDAERFDDYVSSSCKQNYSKVRLLTLKNDRKTLELDDFYFPCGCMCRLNENKERFFEIYY